MNVIKSMRMLTSGTIKMGMFAKSLVILFVASQTKDIFAYSPRWQFTLLSGYGISMKDDRLGTGYSKPAKVDSATYITFYDKWGSLGNGFKFNLQTCKYYHPGIGLQINIGVSFYGINKIENKNGDISYCHQYNSTYYYFNFGPKLRIRYSKFALYSFFGVGYLIPIQVEYEFRYLIGDKFMNPHSSDIYTEKTTLEYSVASGTAFSLGAEYMLNRSWSINIEINGSLYSAFEKSHLEEWYDLPDLGSNDWGKSYSSPWPHSFNSYSLKTGISFFIN